jgi:hypothetical protein
VPPSGTTLEALRCLEKCLEYVTRKPCDLLVTGGQEKTGHSKNSHHYKNEAVDIAGPQYNNYSDTDMFDCGYRCGFKAGHFESFPDQPWKNHWHLQISPGNGVPALPDPGLEE